MAAVLAILVPGLGHAFSGRLRAGALWCVAILIGYWAVFVPGAVLHAFSVWSAFRAASPSPSPARPTRPSRRSGPP